MDRKDIQLVVCGIEEDLVGVLTRSGLRERIGEPNIFYADNKLFQSTELALARALSIVEMERRRLAAAAAVQSKEIAKPTGITARALMSRSCIRFGHQHQLREAIWLLSEMNKRQGTPDPHPLFLQDREGKLAGVLSTWRLLREMTEGLDPEKAESMSDAEIGRFFRNHFIKSIEEMARTDIPKITPETGFAELLHRSVGKDLRVMPISDDGGRVIGLVGQSDLLAGLGKALDLDAKKILEEASETAAETAAE